ncbi:MAG: hypothetical protein ACI4CS_00875 [Candidatus Weimeria sp.]
MLEDIQKKRVWTKRIFVFLSVFLITAVSLFPTANAESWKYFPQRMCDQINTGVSKIITSFFLGSSSVQKSSDDQDSVDMDIGGDQDNGSDLYQWVIGTRSGDSIKDEPVLVNFMNGCGVIAFAIAVLIALVRYSDAVEKGADPMEQFFKFLIEIMIVGILMLKLTDIIGLIAKAGTALISQLTPTGDDVTGISLVDLGLAKDEHDAKIGGLKWLRAVAILFLPWIASYLLTIAAYFVAFSILLELGIRRIFMPFAVADIYGEGLRSPGMRYLKKYFAAFVKIMICLAVSYLAGALNSILAQSVSKPAGGASATIFQVLGYVFMMIALNFTSISVMLKGGEYANDIVGA